jgi:DNA-binding transcriptional LysR family regulator
MELQQLQHFIAVARTGNIGRAADELHITHSGLSRSIKSLEDFLGLPLFQRLSRGVVITPFGEALLPRATHILNERARAINELEALRALRTGQVEVALHPVFEDGVAADVIDRFAHKFPDVEIDIWSGADPELSDRIIAGEFDFAFTLFSAIHDEQMLAYETLFELPVGAYATLDFPDASQPLDIDALLAAEWVLLGASAFRRTFDDYFRSIGKVPPRRIRQVSSMALVKAIMADGARLTLLPHSIARRHPTLFQPIDTVMPKRVIEGGIVYRRDSYHSIPTQSLIRAFREGAEALR